MLVGSLSTSYKPEKSPDSKYVDIWGRSDFLNDKDRKPELLWIPTANMDSCSISTEQRTEKRKRPVASTQAGSDTRTTWHHLQPRNRVCNSNSSQLQASRNWPCYCHLWIWRV